MVNQCNIGPQPGPQTDFLSSAADIAIFGGGAGGGKSFALLLEPLRHYANPKFGGVIFRRNTTQVRNEGGLWDQSQVIYSQLAGTPREMSLEWTFPSGSRIRFAHLEHASTVYDWQGSEIPYIGFDELTHFSKEQFFYMLSRNRSTSGIAGYVRATCNPDSDSWVKELISWWIGADGYPIRERSGVLRWFIRQGDQLIWGNSRRELIEKYGFDQLPKSLTFIPSLLTDNKILMEKDPAYRGNLLALDRVNRERLLNGNWNVRAAAGTVLRREWFPFLDLLPPTVKSIRFWDRAATLPSESNPDPDFTVGLLLKKTESGQFIVADIRRIRNTSLKVQELIISTANSDGIDTVIYLEQEPGSSGVADVQNLSRLLIGFRVKIFKPSKDKITRALPVSAEAEKGNILLLRSPYWNQDFLDESDNFPTGKHDDQIDALSGAFNAMLAKPSVFDTW